MSALLGGQGECWRKSCSETEGAKEGGGEGCQRPWQGPTQFEGAFKRSCCSTHPEKVSMELTGSHLNVNLNENLAGP